MKVKKIMLPQRKEGQELKKQTTDHYKANSHHSKKFLVCCFVAMKVPK
jgi:hypothetical protein